jgi:hypothetical protein
MRFFNQRQGVAKMGFLEMLKMLLGLLPVVMEVVPAVEAAFPGKGLGAQKLQAVLSTVKAVALAAPDVLSSGAELRTSVKVGDVENITGGLTHMIGAVVSLANATGAFQKSGFVQAVTASGLAAPGPASVHAPVAAPAPAPVAAPAPAPVAAPAPAPAAAPEPVNTAWRFDPMTGAPIVAAAANENAASG